MGPDLSKVRRDDPASGQPADPSIMAALSSMAPGLAPGSSPVVPVAPPESAATSGGPAAGPSLSSDMAAASPSPATAPAMSRPDAAKEINAAIPVSHPSFANPFEAMASYNPKIDLPDPSSMPAHARTTDLRAQRDSLDRPVGGGWKRSLINIAERVAPAVIAGLATHSLAGAGAGAKGTMDQINLQHDRLTHDIDESQGVEQHQYDDALKAREIEQTAKGNLLFHAGLVGSRVGLGEDQIASHERIAADNNATRKLVAGYDRNGQPIPQEQMGAVQQAAIGLKNAQRDLAEARKTMLPDQLKLATQRLEIAQRNMELHAQSVGLDAARYEADFFGTHDGQDIPGMPQIDGQTIGPRAATATAPNPTDRTTIKQSKSIQQASDELSDFVDKHRELFGPGKGRGQNFEHWLGNNTYDSNYMRGLIESYFSMNPYMHKFRSMGAVQGFKKAVGGFEQDPDALIGGIKGTTRGAEILGDQAGKPVNATPDGVNPFKRSGKPKSASAPSSSSSVITHRYVNGKVVPVPVEAR